MEMYRRTYAEINLDHIAHNFEAIKKALPQAPFICPMVKAKAYGHGDVAVALCLEKVGAKHLGVCTIEEGLTLRKGGVSTDILVFVGFDAQGAKVMIENRLTPVVSTWAQFEALQGVATQSVQIHLKFNTGMSRLGFEVSDAQKLFERCWQNPKVRVQGILTHLHSGEDAFDPSGESARQLGLLEKVNEIFKPLNPIVHSLNSAGVLSSVLVRSQNITNHPLNRLNWGLRPGLMMYGYNPLVPQDVLPLKAVMTFKSVATDYRKLEAGDVVSYGGTWKATRPSVIAVVPAGYADGYHRILSSKSHMLFAGKRVPVVGRVCMDFIMIDVTDVVQGKALDKIGEQEVILFGHSSTGEFLSAAELAKHAQTVSWEILTSVGERVPRVYVGAWAKKLGVES